jgi:hypothetical protein
MGKSKRIWPSDKGDIITSTHIVHEFRLGDVDDPDIYAAGPIFDWERSEAGQFVMKHAVDIPSYHSQPDYNSFGYRYAIVAELEAKKLSEFYLRWGKNGSNSIR